MSAAKKKRPARDASLEAEPLVTVTESPAGAESKPLGSIPAGWRALEAEPLPRPTVWPAALAFAVTFLLWGIISSPFIAGVGTLLFIFSIAGWIGEIRHEARSHH